MNKLAALAPLLVGAYLIYIGKDTSTYILYYFAKF